MTLMSELIATARSTSVTPDARAGVRAMLPVVIAYVPFGVVVGAAVAGSADPVAAAAGLGAGLVADRSS